MSQRLFGRYIVSDPDICHGKPTFRGTRILVADVLEQEANVVAVQNGTVGNVHPLTAVENQPGGIAPDVGDMQAGQCAILAVAKHDAVVGIMRIGVFYPRETAAEIVGADNDVRTVFDQQIM